MVSKVEVELIDNILISMFEQLERLSKSIDFDEVAQFTTDNAEESIPWEDITLPGIYLLEIQNNGKFNNFGEWIKHFKPKWDDKKHIKKNTARLKPKGIKARTKLEDWILLYVGYSENMANDIRKHIYENPNDSTHVLKLKARENLNDDLFRISIFSLPDVKYDTAISTLGRHATDNLNPLVKKPRFV